MNIVKNDDIINYENRPSRANMQPKALSLWFAKMKILEKSIF